MRIKIKYVLSTLLEALGFILLLATLLSFLIIGDAIMSEFIV